MKKLLFFLAFLTSLFMYSQAGYLSVDAGADLTGNCGQNQSLTATYTDLKDTSTYVATSLAYAPPTDFINGTVPGGLTSDDQWSDPVDIGFSFCYFGNTFTQVTIGSNGEVSFDTAYNTDFNHWDLSNGGVPITLPQPNSDSDLTFNTIFGPGHDIDPSVSGDIKYELIGTAPFRAFVIKYNQVAQFSCNALSSTSMIVLYESTNNIDVFIKDKPICPGWNDGYAVVGITNADGTIGITPPGRNTSQWEVENGNATYPSEAWRFIPNGASVTSFDWTDAGGTVLGTTPTITVTPFMTTTYTANAHYTLCDGTVIDVSDDMTVATTLNGPLIDLGPDTVLCDTASMMLDATPSNAASFTTITYIWSTGETTPQITATSAGTYSVTVTVDGGCMAVDEIALEFGVTPVLASQGDYHLCNAAPPAVVDPVTITVDTVGQDPTQFTYEWRKDGNATIIGTTQSISVSEIGSYTVTVTGGSCSSTQTILVTYYNNEYCTYPEGISPNGDQYNERFDLQWLNDQVGIKNLKIFNRLGTLVFERANYSNEFEGKSDNDYELPSGTYFYVIQLADDTVKEGWVYINR